MGVGFWNMERKVAKKGYDIKSDTAVHVWNSILRRTLRSGAKHIPQSDSTWMMLMALGYLCPDLVESLVEGYGGGGG